MEAYKRWVRLNKDYVHSLESLANGLTWLLPERFSDSEIGPEAGVEKNEEDDGVENKRDDVDCGLGDFETRPIFVGVMEKGIVEAVFPTVLLKFQTHSPTQNHPSHHPHNLISSIILAKLAHIEIHSQPLYTTTNNKHQAASQLPTLHKSISPPVLRSQEGEKERIIDLETLIEVVAQHYYGDDKKWNFIAVTEASKVLVRLALFRNSGYKMLLHGGETPNNEKQSDASTSQHKIGGFTKPEGPHESGYLMNNHAQNPWNLEGRALSALNRFGENARMVSDPAWLRRVQHQHAIMQPPTSVVQRPTISTILSEKGLHGALFLAGEVLFITRPLIYVLFIRKYGIRSWIPWFLSLTVDFVGMGILSKVTESGCLRKEQQFHLSNSEKDEVKRRKLLLALYIMRDPFFSKYTRERLESTKNVLEPVPIIGFLTDKIVDLIIGAQTRYTYMSGS
ncbi:peroxisome biogenesis protein 16 [Fagus crenata]